MILRVATWNVEYAADAGRNARRLELLQAAAADIVVLTETHDDLRLDGYEATSTLQRPGARAGARWTTIWSRLAVRRVIDTEDPLRTVAVELESDLLVYGTVLPWHSDPGPSEGKKVNWSEYRRVVPIQGAEWLALRRQEPEHTLVVAGDFNQGLGERHYYGGKSCDGCSSRSARPLASMCSRVWPISRCRWLTLRSTTSQSHQHGGSART